MVLTHVDLFSGIGGFALATNWAGFETIVFCEIDSFCQKVLRKHWPEVPIEGDIRKFDGTRFTGGATLLTGGFPCQPFSVAGKRGGKEDDRFLWPEMFRIIKEVKPRWILAENVPGIVNMALGQVLSDLEGEGYDFPRDLAGNIVIPIIPAVGKNAPHRRDRVWIIAHAGLLGQAECEKQTTRFKQSGEDVADPEKQGLERRDGNEREVIAGFGQGNIDASDSQGGQSGKQTEPERREDIGRGSWQENWYEVATRLCVVDDGLSAGLVRPKGWRVNALKAAGNAIVPQVAYEILKGIAEIENGK